MNSRKNAPKTGGDVARGARVTRAAARGLFAGWTRRFSLVLILAVAIVVGAIQVPAGAADVKDVPPDHWAYKAVQSLVDKGYLTLYQDGTFQGTRAVDRYTFADVIARLLSQLQAGGVEAAPEDVKTLSRLVNEFRTELAQVVSNSKDLAASLAQLKSENAVLREDLTKVGGDTYTNKQDLARAQQDLSAAKKELGQQIASVLADVAALKNATAARDAAQDKALADHSQSLGALNQSLASTAQGVSALSGRVGSLEKAMETLSGGSVKLGTQLESLQGAAGGLDGRVKTLETGFNDLSPKMAESLDAIDNLQKALDALRVDLEQGRKAQDDKDAGLTARLDAVNKDLAAQVDATSKGLAELRQSLASQGESLGKQDAETQALRQKLGELETAVGSAREDVKKLGDSAADLDQRVNGLTAELDVVKTQLGDLRRQVGQDLSSQEAGQLVRQRNVQAQMTSLQDEFSSYRRTSEKQIEDLKRNNTLLLLGVILAAVIGVLVP